MKAALARCRPDLVLPSAAWSKPWVVDCTAWGDGAEAVLRYLARYVFRIAITESRIIGLDDTGVTIRHKHRASGRWRNTYLHGREFMRRFLQHVLPKGFHKVRYSGLWHPSRRDAATRARHFLALDRSVIAPSDPPAAEPAGVGEHQSTTASDAAPRICPCCKAGHLVHVRKLYPMQVRGP
jgi:Putative transposase